MTNRNCSEWKNFISEVTLGIEIKYENLVGLEIHNHVCKRCKKRKISLINTVERCL